MDEFIVEIRKNLNQIEKHEMRDDNKNSIVKHVLGLFINADIELKTIGFSDDGFVTFSININDFLTDNKIYVKNKGLFFSKFFMNMTGEYLVRENIDVFSRMIIMFQDKLEDSILEKNHSNFGITITPNGTMIYEFHPSLLITILSEDVQDDLIYGMSM